MRNRLFYIFLLAFFSALGLKAQHIPVEDAALTKKYPFVSTVFNRLQNTAGLDTFYQKLATLKSSGNSNISIVHIGDSHIQPDFLTAVVRTGLQDFFGNAGRGLVFPYQLAQSNSPDDISSSSGTNWQFNRLAHPEIPLPYGISGYGVRTTSETAMLRFTLRSETHRFKRLRFFISDTDSSNKETENYWTLRTADSMIYRIEKKETDQLAGSAIELPETISGFSLLAPQSVGNKELYGFSLENAKPGILYHCIGVNGARYDQYNNASLFWQQLPALQADLYIISLGTNEAQRAAFNETAFLKEVESMIERLKMASPGAAVLICTAPDSYKGRAPNKILQQLNQSLAAYCNKNFIPFWDLYRITNGYGSAYSWSRRGLMSRDRIHFTAEGYRIMGTLLLNALAKSYNATIFAGKAESR